MASTEILAMGGLATSVTPSSLFHHFFRDLVDTAIFRIREPLHNEWIFLPNPPPMGLVDAHQGRNLIFFVKQYELGLVFPFTPFFIEVFQHFRVTLQMLSPNSILFMCYFKSIYLCWGFIPSIDLFFAFFHLVRSSHKFYYFGLRTGLL